MGMKFNLGSIVKYNGEDPAVGVLVEKGVEGVVVAEHDLEYEKRVYVTFPSIQMRANGSPITLTIAEGALDLKAAAPAEPPAPPKDETILVAFSVAGAASREEAHRFLEVLIPKSGSTHDSGPGTRMYIESWWVAEDDRQDGSDNDSAVFVSPGNQAIASALLHAQGMTPDCNIVSPDRDVVVPTDDDLPIPPII